MQKQSGMHHPPLYKNSVGKRKNPKSRMITITDSNLSLDQIDREHSDCTHIQEELPDGITTPIKFKEEPDEEGSISQNLMSHIFQSIQNEVDYNSMSMHQIESEKRELENHLKFLNFQLNELLSKKELERKDVQSKVSRKMKSLKEKQKEESQMLANQKLIENMRNQYKSLKGRLNSYEETDSKIKFQRKIAESEQELKKLRLNLVERKRKNVLGEKKIAQMDKKDSHKVYFDLQQQFVALSKKKENYQKKLQSLTDQNAKLTVNSEQIDNKYLIATEKVQDIKNEEQRVDNQQHNNLLYETNKRRLQLALKKRLREEEMFKKRYYELLKQYEKVVDRTQEQQNKIDDLDQKNQYVGTYLMLKKERLSAKSTSNQKERKAKYWTNEPHQHKLDISEQSIDLPNGGKFGRNRKGRDDGGGFMLTEPQQEEEAYSSEQKGDTKRKNFNNQGKDQNNQLNKDNKCKSLFEIRKFQKNKKKPELISTQKFPTENFIRAESTPNRKTKYNFKYKKHPKHFHTQIVDDTNNRSDEQDEQLRIQTEQIQPLLHSKKEQRIEEKDEQKTRLKCQKIENNGADDDEYEDDFQKLSVSGHHSPLLK